MIALLRTIDQLFWDDRYEEFRSLVMCLVAIVVAIYFSHAVLASLIAWHS